jgi:hypothetical protein
MCWETKKCIKPHIADKDLHVYKICLRYYNYGALPYFQKAREFYEEGKTYDADHFDKPRPLIPLYSDHYIYEIYHGMHSYSCKCQLMQGAITNGVNLVLVTPLSPKGVIAHYNTKLNIILALCSIPKGTTYYVNENGEYVSESIKMDKFLVFTKNTIDTLNEELKKWNND